MDYDEKPAHAGLVRLYRSELTRWEHSAPQGRRCPVPVSLISLSQAGESLLGEQGFGEAVFGRCREVEPRAPYGRAFKRAATARVAEVRDEYSSDWAATVAVAGALGVKAHTLYNWLRCSRMYVGTPRHALGNAVGW
jgi:hypothetical protein